VSRDNEELFFFSEQKLEKYFVTW